MKETPAEHERATGMVYAPPAAVTRVARLLAPDEPCGALYRYPGPCGLASFFAGELAQLGPPGAPLLWMSERPLFEDTAGARHFGTLVLARPLSFRPGKLVGRRGIYIGVNRPLAPGDDVAWLPPSRLAIAGTGAAARVAPEERAAVIDDLCRYLEELDAMRRSGAPGPGVPWCQVPLGERRQRLARAGVAGVWTEKHADAAVDCGKMTA